MSIIFFDHLIKTAELEMEISSVCNSSEEKQELWSLIDEIIHYRIIHTILDNLPEENHDEFMEKFYSAPYAVELLDYLNEKLSQDTHLLISNTADSCVENILLEIRRS